ncbi:MAG: phenylacetate-CoA oxygenase/reductase subunit PaaK [Bacteroidetes bacterium]|nr:phenylacetate-CoA oxygenase/reductase subunit PaaK [Bacteroidota bacterium]
MPKFHRLKVRDIRLETLDCVSIRFEVPPTLKPEYEFLPGQHLTLKTDLEGKEVRRSYSICASPLEDELRVAVKQVVDGAFSSFAKETLKIGDELDVMTPMGNFTLETSPQNRKHYVAFAAGSGITPVISMLKSVMRNELTSHFTLFYGNRTTESIIFRDEIEDLKNEYLTRLSVHHVLSQEDLGADLFLGRIDVEKSRMFCTKLLDISDVDAFYLCGPEAMIFSVKDTLLDLGVDEKIVHFELFTTPGAAVASSKNWSPDPKLTASKITVTLDGNTFTYNHLHPTETILDAASKSVADLPFACKGGVCCTCKAKLLQGEVEMEVCYGLEKEEVEAGYILTCQAHPKTEEVVLSFDE